jgi:hypothetical protein
MVNKEISKLVIIESPYKGENFVETINNKLYAEECMKDCFSRGEYPFVGSLLYSGGILDERIAKERNLGIEAALTWARNCNAKTVVYTDRGISSEMEIGIKRAEEENRKIEYRTLNKN